MGANARENVSIGVQGERQPTPRGLNPRIPLTLFPAEEQ